MSLALLLVCLSLLQGCIAPAVSDVTVPPASPFLDTTFLLASSNSTSDTCNDINICRTMVGIVTSCLATIFACIWVAVHPNIPGPNQGWIARQFELLKVVVVTLLVPEWVLAWAVRQFLQARHYAGILERARVDAADEATLQHNRSSPHEGHTTRSSSSSQERDQAVEMRLEAMSTSHNNSSTDSTGSVSEIRIGEPNEERTNLILRQSFERSSPVPQKSAHKLVYIWEVEGHLGRTMQSWTTSHGFLAIMGGFYYYRNGEPMFPLQVDQVRDADTNEDYILALVQSRSLAPPTLEELGDRSKGDTLSKSIAVLQTLWFMIQCIARRVENLAITNLEIMTLAYTVITVAMYAAWWHKPLNVRCPIRVLKGDKKYVKGTKTRSSTRWSDIIDYVTGDQDYLICLRDEERVPTFWSSCTSLHDNKLPLYSDLIALLVAMVFGAVHCAAWSYVFPSPPEKWMWRVCAIAIAAIPLTMVVAFAVFDPFNAAYNLKNSRSNYIPVIFMVLGALLYIPARIILLVLSFTTLRHLPLSVYQTVQWTTWIPHI